MHSTAHVQVVLTALLTQPRNALTAVPRGVCLLRGSQSCQVWQYLPSQKNTGTTGLHGLCEAPRAPVIHQRAGQTCSLPLES